MTPFHYKKFNRAISVIETKDERPHAENARMRICGKHTLHIFQFISTKIRSNVRNEATKQVSLMLNSACKALKLRNTFAEYALMGKNLFITVF